MTPEQLAALRRALLQVLYEMDCHAPRAAAQRSTGHRVVGATKVRSWADALETILKLTGGK